MRLGRCIVAAALLAGCGSDDLGDLGRKLTVRTPWVTDDDRPLLDFGPIPVLDSRTEPVELESLGRDNVDIQSIELENAPEGVFQLLLSATYEESEKLVEPPFKLPTPDVGGALRYGSKKLRFEVKFTPQEQTEYAGARVKIVHNAPDSPTYVELVGAGDTSGTIAVEPSPLDFGRVGEMQQSVLSAQIQSVGTGPLVIRKVELAPAAGKESVPVEITFAGSTNTEGIVLPPPGGGQPGGSIQIPVRCAPTTDTEQVLLEAVLRIESNDLAHRTTDVPVICRVNRAPIAEIVEDGNRYGPGDEITGDGTPSHDPDGDDPIEYLWSLSTPPGSEAELDDPTSATPTFVADVAGTYVLTLVVQDATGVPCVPTAGGAIASCDRIEYEVESPEALLFELSWEHALTDLDIHVVEDGYPYMTEKDCWWQNRRGTSPPGTLYPGVSQYCAKWNTAEDGDDPSMFPDALSRYGPERVFLGEGGVIPPPGVYEVGVHFAKTNGVPSGEASTRAILRVYVYGRLAAQKDLILEPSQFWRVFKVDWDAVRGGAEFEYVGEVIPDWMP